MNLEQLPQILGTESQAGHLLDAAARRDDIVAQVPTLDDDVRVALRRLGEPITLFGEDRASRRERLLDLVTKNAELKERFLSVSVSPPSEMDEDEDEEFYTPGTEDLLQARLEIADSSLQRAKARTIALRELALLNQTDVLVARRRVNEKLGKVALFGTQVISNRYTSVVRASAKFGKIAAGSWDGKTYILDPDTLATEQVLLGHEEKVGGVDWHPTEQCVITSGAEGAVNLYDLSIQQSEAVPRASFRGHQGRVCRVEFHPSGNYFASASFDLTWRYWDVRKQVELYYQEGHSKEVFCVSHNPDGSLIASAGMDAIARVWDLRSGKSIMVLEGHAKGIYSMDWHHGNGVELLTGSADSSIKVWDLRMSTKEKVSVAAHKSLVSDIRFCDESVNVNGRTLRGTHFATASYDGSLGLFSADNWLKVKSLQSSGEKVMSCDLLGDKVISGGWDKSVKLWSI